MADMKDDSRQAERQWDKEFGYTDEDPIERYVKLHMPRRRKSILVPADSAGAAAARASDIAGLPPVSQLGAMGLGIHVEDVDAGPSGSGSQEPPEPVDQFRPGLIQFHRTHSGQSSRRGIPSFGHCTDEGTATSADSSPFGNGMDTPGSQWSEASFEAIKPEDVMSLYGAAVGSSFDLAQSPMPTGLPSSARYANPRASILSSISTVTALSTISGTSDATFSTATAATAKAVRPGLGRPRPRATANPYPGDGESRAKERDQAGEAGKLGVPAEDDEEWLSGRTISEQMIAQAGIRCQRGRAGLRR
jgi:hypothetical protein